MPKRWVPHFLAMLKYMENLGQVGSSRAVGIYADGDGDFRPKFYWDKNESSEDIRDALDDVQPVEDNDGHRLYDAG